MDAVEYRAFVKFLYLKGRVPRETFVEIKEIYGEVSLSCDVVKNWHRQIKCARTSVGTAPIAGRPRSAIDEHTIHQVEAAILENRRVTVRDLVRNVKISVGSMEKIIQDHLQMR